MTHEERAVRLMALLEKANLSVTREPGGAIRVDGREVFVAAHETPERAARRIATEVELDDAVDLARLLAREVPGVAVERAGRELLFRLDGGIAARLSSDMAKVAGEAKLDRAASNHAEVREYLRAGLRRAAFARPTRHVRAVRASQYTDHVYLKLPNGLPQSVRRAALFGSERLRTGRAIDPALAVEVETDLGTFRFEPVELRNPVEAVFRLERGPDHFVGGLRLRTPGDPLALRIHDYGSGRLFADAWAGALVLYAHLTCPAGDPPAEGGPTNELRVRAPSARSDAAPNASSGGRATRSRTEVGSEVRYESMTEAHRALQAVSGHLRRLPEGRDPGQAARQTAELLGIALPPGCTWVRAHHRGHGVIRLLRSAVPDLW